MSTALTRGDQLSIEWAEQNSLKVVELARVATTAIGELGSDMLYKTRRLAIETDNIQYDLLSRGIRDPLYRDASTKIAQVTLQNGISVMATGQGVIARTAFRFMQEE